MVNGDYLLFIDNIPVDEKLIAYFSQFNMQIVQINNIKEIPENFHVLPVAILVHWNQVDNNPGTIRTLYQNHPTSILVFQDSDNEQVCIQALESGADDCINQPLNPRELHARINAIRRRVNIAINNLTLEKTVYLFANLKLIPSSRQVFDEDAQELQLSSGEFDLLYAFVKQPQQIMDRDELLQITKSTNLHPFDRRIDVQISRLRQKIETDTKRPALIKTIRNGGYLFTAEVVMVKE